MTEKAKKPDVSLPTAEISKLLTSVQGLSLATTSSDNTPLASYAPFILFNGRIYVFLSALSEHTRHMLAAPNVGLMLLAEPDTHKNPFARQRLSLNAVSRALLRDTELWLEVINAMTLQLGGTMQILRTLPDFTLFELEVNGGNFVKGFGAAYTLTAADWAEITAI